MIGITFTDHREGLMAQEAQRIYSMAHTMGLQDPALSLDHTASLRSAEICGWVSNLARSFPTAKGGKEICLKIVSPLHQKTGFSLEVFK